MSEQTAIEKFREPGGDILHLGASEIQNKLAAIDAFQKIVHKSLVPQLDYGVIPGTDKPTLLKPGAEKVAKLLNLADTYEIAEKVEMWDKPFFSYTVRCTLTEISSGAVVCAYLANCNSYESKYRWRWVNESGLPSNVDKASLVTRGGRQTQFEPLFALQKRDTMGKYGKPVSYWDSWENDIASGVAKKATKKLGTKEFDGWERTVDTIQYRIENDDIFTQLNTIMKMAEKRAMLSAVLSVARLSLLFTVDMEDYQPEVTYERERGDEKGQAGEKANVPSPDDGTPPPASNPPSTEKTKKSGAPRIEDGRYTDDKYPVVTELVLPDGTKVAVSRFKALELYENMKKSIGEERYYDVLASCKYNKASEVTDEELAVVYTLLAGEWRKVRGRK